MATLEDKILGDKIHNYCSSSEDEFESSDEGNDKSNPLKSHQASGPPPDLTQRSGATENTGPKGVINDWQRYKQLENEKREAQEKEKIELLKKLSITCRTNAEDDKAKEEEELDPELRELMRDEMLLQFQRQRMNEMLQNAVAQNSFNQVFALDTGDDFLNAVDKENKYTTVIIHIYEAQVKACRTMNKCLDTLAQEYSHVKFCRMLSSCAGMSIKFKLSGVPALLVYKGGQMIGNFIRLSDEFGDEFYASDVESFLIEHAMIDDRSCVPAIAKTIQTNNKYADADDGDDDNDN